MIAATAPGKLMISGEYAVAFADAPAIAVALDRGARVTLDPDGGPWRISSSGLGLDEADPKAVPVVASALEHAAPEGVTGHLIIESDLGCGPEKPGLGASAAITVACLGVLRRVSGAGAPPLTMAIDVHRAAQGGVGSGFDVATSLLGGVISFARTGSGAVHEPLNWPSSLHYAVMYTGAGSKTSSMLSLLASCDADMLAPLVDASRRTAEAWHGGDPSDVLHALATAEDALITLAGATGAPLLAPRYLDVAHAVRAEGAVLRTSGAGGGDCVWIFGASSAAVDRGADAAASHGYERLTVHIGAAGLTVEEATG